MDNFKLASDYLRNIIKTLNSFRKILIYTTIHPSIKNCKPHKKSCYIFLNGPSLNEDILDKIDFLLKQDIFVVNFMPGYELFKKIRPKYIVLADPVFFNIDNYKNGLKEKMNSFQENVNNADWELKIMIPYKKNFMSFNDNKNVEVLFYNSYSFLNGFNSFRYYCFKRGIAMPSMVSVLIPCIMNAITIGYKEINIMGADHDWINNIFIDERNKMYMKNTHFYETDPEPISLSYSMSQILRGQYQAFLNYEIIRRYADYYNIKIYNLSKKSMIDSFERKNIIME